MNQRLVLNPVLIYNSVNWFSLWEPGWELPNTEQDLIEPVILWRNGLSP
jgi:hypothetical protein